MSKFATQLYGLLNDDDDTEDVLSWVTHNGKDCIQVDIAQFDAHTEQRTQKWVSQFQKLQFKNETPFVAGLDREKFKVFSHAFLTRDSKDSDFKGIRKRITKEGYKIANKRVKKSDIEKIDQGVKLEEETTKSAEDDSKKASFIVETQDVELKTDEDDKKNKKEPLFPEMDLKKRLDNVVSDDDMALPSFDMGQKASDEELNLAASLFD